MNSLKWNLSRLKTAPLLPKTPFMPISSRSMLSKWIYKEEPLNSHKKIKDKSEKSKKQDNVKAEVKNK